MTLSYIYEEIKGSTLIWIYSNLVDEKKKTLTPFPFKYTNFQKFLFIEKVSSAGAAIVYSQIATGYRKAI